MNDVKVISTEFALKQSASAASTSVKPEATESSPEQKTNDAEKSTREIVEAGAERVEEAVASLNEYVQSVQRDLQFRLDDSSGKTVITVFDSSTEEVVRQIPDDVALRLARDLQQDEPISLFNAKV